MINVTNASQPALQIVPALGPRSKLAASGASGHAVLPVLEGVRAPFRAHTLLLPWPELRQPEWTCL